MDGNAIMFISQKQYTLCILIIYISEGYMITGKVIHGLIMSLHAKREIDTNESNMAKNITAISNSPAKVNVPNPSQFPEKIMAHKQSSSVVPGSKIPVENPKNYTFVRDIDYGDDKSPCAMNVLVSTKLKPDFAGARGMILNETNGAKTLHVTGMYIDDNSNTPTLKKPNQYSGIGTQLMYELVKFGSENGALKISVTPVDRSEGFYLKMGFSPKAETTPNRMEEKFGNDKYSSGKIKPTWIKEFEKSSFLHPLFRNTLWTGDTNIILDNITKKLGTL